MEMKEVFKGLAKEAKSQGMVECFVVSLLLSHGMYLFSGDIGIVVRCACAFLMVMANTYFLWDAVYMYVVVPAVFVAGMYCNKALAFASLHAVLFDRNIRGMPRSFTGGEIFLHTHLLVVMLEFSLQTFSSESEILMFPLKMFVVVCLIYHWISKFVAPLSDPKSECYLSIPSLLLSALLAIAFAVIDSAVNNSSAFSIWPKICEMAAGTEERKVVCVYALAFFLIGLSAFPFIKSYFKMGLIASRKYFHLASFVFFTPTVIYAPEMTMLFMAIGFTLTTVVEYLRLHFGSSSKILSLIGNYYGKFTPAEMHSKFNFASPSMFAGSLFPLVTTYFLTRGNMNGPHLIAALCGILFFSIGDSVTALIGSNFGVRKWPGSKKTYWGSFCAAFICILINSALIYFLVPQFTLGLVLRSAIAVSLMCAYEGFTLLNDNVLVSAFTYACYLNLEKLLIQISL